MALLADRASGRACKDAGLGQECRKCFRTGLPHTGKDSPTSSWVVGSLCACACACPTVSILGILPFSPSIPSLKQKRERVGLRGSSVLACSQSHIKQAPPCIYYQFSFENHQKAHPILPLLIKHFDPVNNHCLFSGPGTRVTETITSTVTAKAYRALCARNSSKYFMCVCLLHANGNLVR